MLTIVIKIIDLIPQKSFHKLLMFLHMFEIYVLLLTSGQGVNQEFSISLIGTWHYAP